MSRKLIQGKTIWITGASSGIGEALAFELAKTGNHLILSSRRVAELERVAGVCQNSGSSTDIIAFDLANPVQVEEAANTVIQKYSKIDILIINGGVSQRSLVRDTPVEIDRHIFEIDYFGGVILAKKVLPSMLQAGAGHMVVISSVTGLFGFPLRSAYSAAKHAIHGFYETLWAEEHKNGIDVTIVCPGRVNTNVSHNAVTKTGEPFGLLDHDFTKGLSVETCARKIVKSILRKKKTVYIVGRERWMIFFRHFIPALYYWLAPRVKPT